MTTPRTRRTKPQQAADILRSLHRTQLAKAEKLHLLWEDAIEEADRTRRAIELLNQAMLPGMEPEPPVDGEPIGATTSDALMLDVPEAINKVGEPRPHRQRIGEKAQGINDVWEPGDGVVTVHSTLMYARQDLCKLCKAGVPFATEKRTEHYVVEIGPNFGYQPCTGVKEQA